MTHIHPFLCEVLISFSVFWFIASSYTYLTTSQPGPGTAKNKNILRVPIQTFYVIQSFFSHDLLRFWSLGYPGIRESGWKGHTCELVWRSIQNLVEIGTAVCV